MTRITIKPPPGSITPASYGPWAAAAEKLAEAAVGILEMQAAKDRVQYQRGWTSFVDAIEVFWQRLHTEGKERFSTFMPWVKSYNDKRNSDEFLTYMLQARHDNTHGGLRPISWSAGGGITIGGHGAGGTFTRLIVHHDGTADLDGTVGVFSEPGSPTLGAIVNKNPRAKGSGEVRTYPPPSNFLGTNVAGIAPLSAAKLAMEFYESAFVEVLARFA